MELEISLTEKKLFDLDRFLSGFITQALTDTLNQLTKKTVYAVGHEYLSQKDI